MYIVYVFSLKLNVCFNLLFYFYILVYVYLFIIELDYFIKFEYNNLIILIVLINYIKIKKYFIYCKRKSLFIKIYFIYKILLFVKLF